MTNKNINRQIGVLAFFQPFFALIFAIKHFRSPWAKNVVWFFTIFYGLTFVFSSEGLDSARYVQTLHEMYQNKVTLDNIISWLYSDETMYIDIFQPLITFLVSLFTDSGQILYAVFGFIYGYFYTRNIWFVFELLPNKRIRLYLIPFFLTLALILPIWNINGIRMWTAAQVFLYGALPFLVNKDKKSLLWVFASMFVHFSFIIAVAIFLLYIFLGNRTILYLTMYLATFFIVEINIRQVKSIIMEYTPSILEKKVTSYTNEDYFNKIQQAQENLNWYVPWHHKALTYTITVFLIIFYTKRKDVLLYHPGMENLYNATLFFGACANVLGKIPSGGRFGTLFYFMAMATILYYMLYAKKQAFIGTLAKISIPALLLFIVVSIRIGFDTIGVWTILGNPLISPFVQHNTSLIQLIK